MVRRHGYTAVSHGKIYHNPTPDPQSWSEPFGECARSGDIRGAWRRRFARHRRNSPQVWAEK
ncbi:MAG: hypothetical protein Ct9H300mP7_6830 [Verrucomicrobiota bacterium]|nr:MAG: hypothetical protein Ct9H300mP7_6830 [Verrucomicrobiota bacterium]